MGSNGFNSPKLAKRVIIRIDPVSDFDNQNNYNYNEHARNNEVEKGKNGRFDQLLLARLKSVNWTKLVLVQNLFQIYCWISKQVFYV